MAMQMTGEVLLPATRERVWAALNDPEMLKACIPGCQTFESTGENAFAAVATNKIGPVKATFKGNVQLLDMDPPNGYRIQGEGNGGIAGFAKGGATVKLSDAEGGTTLAYEVEAQIGGKLAQLGQRLINGVAKSMADKFFESFKVKLTPAG
jgi:carbon monoxide dehydrogenase subunit G